jgi:hypothetical protein
MLNQVKTATERDNKTTKKGFFVHDLGYTALVA